MPTSHTAGPYPIPDVQMPTWMVRFDKDGLCASPATRTALLAHLTDTDYTDVLFYSHGWNTDFSDAVGQYGSFIASFERVIEDHPIDGFRPVFVGVTWPSVWMAANEGPRMAAGASDLPAEESRIAVVGEIVGALAARDRDRAYELLDSTVLTPEQGLELAAMLAPMLGGVDSDLGESDATVAPEQVLAAASAIGAADRGGVVAAGNELGPTGLADDSDPGRVRPAIAGGLEPSSFLRLFSLFQMKDRAGRVGSTGVADLLRDLLAIEGRRVHVFGHSFGAKVMLSAIAAEPGPGRSVDSLLLLQPAISHLAFASSVPGREGPGGYRIALERVRHPVLTTFSRLDRPLHDVFHLAVRRPADLGELRVAAAGEPPNRHAALGGYGPRGAGELLVDPIPAAGAAWPALQSAALVGLDGSDDRIKGHSDVANQFTAWALRHRIATR